MTVYVGSLVIVAGTDVLAFGWPTGLGGIGKWLGGFMIFFIIGILTLPICLGLRFVIERLGQRNLRTATAAGTLVGLAIIPALQPMYPDISMTTMPVGLLLVHVLAGCAGGLAWYVTELSQTPRPQRTV